MIVKKGPYNYPVQMIKIVRTGPKNMRIKIHKTTHDDKTYSSMSVLLDLGRIPRKKQKKKVSETTITGNKVTQDPYDTNKEEKVGSSIERTK